jgi:hypothetical protein
VLFERHSHASARATADRVFYSIHRSAADQLGATHVACRFRRLSAVLGLFHCSAGYLDYMMGFLDFDRENAQVSIKKADGCCTGRGSLPNVEIEDRNAVQQVVESHAAGLDFADALHHMPAIANATGWRPSTTAALRAAPGDWGYCHR